MTAPFGGAKGPIVGRNMFVWQLDRVIKAEGGPIGVAPLWEVLFSSAV